LPAPVSTDQNLELVGLGCFRRRQDLGDDEGLEGRLVVDVFDFEADRRQRSQMSSSEASVSR
jgi:hypothetical protein